jgi:CheY-like chemotaxis protein
MLFRRVANFNVAQKSCPHKGRKQFHKQLLYVSIGNNKVILHLFMNNSGIIIIIEDDTDDQQLFAEAYHSLGYSNEIKFLKDGQEALDFLTSTGISPFLILSDINMPKLNGYALREKIRMDEKLQVKCIPYLFFTTAADKQAIIDAYSLSVQGFFIKPDSLGELTQTIKCIVEYWKKCSAPNNY